MTEIKLMSASEALAKRLAEDPELAALVEAERDYREHRLLRACQSLHKRWKTVQNEAHKPCTCGTDTNPDICVCPKCLDAWIVGNGAEFLDRVTAGLRKKAVSWCRLLDACQSLHKRWKESRTGSGR